MYGILGAAGYGNWPIIKQIAWLLGQIMNLIFNFLDKVFGIQNIGLCIIIFTVIVYTLMIPLTIKQQKFSKMSAVMNPEIQKLQKKYAGKRDQASQMKMQEEMNLIYEKYGTSPTGGCLPMLIQFPMLFALYPVIQNIPKYVTGVRNVYMPIVNEIMSIDGFQKIMENIGKAKPVLMSPDTYNYGDANILVQVLYKFQDATWATLQDKMPALSDSISQTMANIGHMNNFLGINIGEAPWTMLTSSLSAGKIAGVIAAIIIPVVAAGAQFISVKLQPTAATTNNNSNDPMAASMKSMTYMMPMMSLFFCFTLPAGLGIYWCASAIVRCIQQVGINKYLKKYSPEDIAKQNQDKIAKKREKNGTDAKELNRMATTNTRHVDKRNVNVSKKDEEKIEQATSYIKDAKPGSLASKAALVSRYNNSQSAPKAKKQEEKKESEEK